MPSFYGFELLGDSMLLRFSMNHADYPPPFLGYQSQWDFCRDGKTIRQLHSDLSYRIGSHHNFIVLIGTNDILLKASSEERLSVEKERIEEDLHKLNIKLSSKGASGAWCTIPPIPLLMTGDMKDRYFELSNAANQKIRSFKNERITIIDLYEHLTRCENFVDFFERSMDLNREGMAMMNLAFEEYLQKMYTL